MRRVFFAAAAFAALHFAVAAAQSAEVTVTDGDTILYDGRQAEIWGIIAPAKGEMCTTTQGEKWPCGDRAAEQLSELAADDTFTCEEKEPGFLLCRVAGLDIGLLLVKEGLVRARQGYRDAEARAREAGVGLWQ